MQAVIEVLIYALASPLPCISIRVWNQGKTSDVNGTFKLALWDVNLYKMLLETSLVNLIISSHFCIHVIIARHLYALIFYFLYKLHVLNKYHCIIYLCMVRDVWIVCPILPQSFAFDALSVTLLFAKIPAVPFQNGKTESETERCRFCCFPYWELVGIIDFISP